MRTGAATTIAGYISAQPPAARAALTQVCAVIRKAVPGAVESISYGMPTFKLGGRALLYVAGWKAHYSLYPSSDRLVATVGAALAPYERSKGTIKFPLDRPVPSALIATIAKVRATMLAEEGRSPRRARR